MSQDLQTQTPELSAKDYFTCMAITVNLPTIATSKTSKEASKAIDDKFKTGDRTRGTVTILASSAEVKAVTNHRQKITTKLKRESSLVENGVYYIPMTEFARVKAELVTAVAEYNSALDDFVAKYDATIAEEKADLGELFQPEAYHGKSYFEALRGTFDTKAELSPAAFLTLDLSSLNADLAEAIRDSVDTVSRRSDQYLFDQIKTLLVDGEKGRKSALQKMDDYFQWTKEPETNGEKNRKPGLTAKSILDRLHSAKSTANRRLSDDQDLIDIVVKIDDILKTIPFADETFKTPIMQQTAEGYTVASPPFWQVATKIGEMFGVDTFAATPAETEDSDDSEEAGSDETANDGADLLASLAE